MPKLMPRDQLAALCRRNRATLSRHGSRGLIPQGTLIENTGTTMRGWCYTREEAQRCLDHYGSEAVLSDAMFRDPYEAAIAWRGNELHRQIADAYSRLAAAHRDLHRLGITVLHPGPTHRPIHEPVIDTTTK